MNITNTYTDKEVIGYLALKKVEITDANSISSPLTYGFPAITGFLGAFHALSRKIQHLNIAEGISLGGVLLACHDCSPQVFRTSQYSDYTFNQQRNPIKKDGTTASIIEEGKCHLTISFVVEVLGEDELETNEKKTLIENVSKLFFQQRIAGGSVHALSSHDPISFIEVEEIDAIPQMLMPAFVLMDATEELKSIIEEMQETNPDATPIDALIETSTIHHTPLLSDDNETNWEANSIKKGRGWLVPMPIGYQGISEQYPALEMQNTRNPEYPSQYTEVLYGLGKWVYPYRLTDRIDTAFWRYSANIEQSIYLVSQHT